MNGNRALIKEAAENSHVPLPREITVVNEPGSGILPDSESAWCFDLGLSASRTVRNKFVFLISHPVYGILLQQPESTENVQLDLFHFLVFILKNDVTNIPTLTTQLLAFLIFAYSLLFIKEIRYYK